VKSGRLVLTRGKTYCLCVRSRREDFYLEVRHKEFLRMVGIYIQGVPGGMDKTSGECFLC